MKRIILLILLTLLLGSVTETDAQFYRRDIKAATVTASDSMSTANINITGTATIATISSTDFVAVVFTTDTATVNDTLYAENIGADSITTNYLTAAILVASVSTDLGDSAKLGAYWITPYGTWTGIFEVNGVGDSIEASATYRNELSPGANPVIARTGEGIFTITFGSTVLTTSKTLIWVTAGATTPNGYILDAKWTSTTVATIYSGTVADGTAADLIGNITVKIEVIP